VNERVFVRTQQTLDAAIGVTTKFIHPYEGPYIISKVIPPSTYELSTSKGKIREEFNKRALKPYNEEENPCAGGRI